jgi:Kef-type K+ transport system membrane component KefB
MTDVELGRLLLGLVALLTMALACGRLFERLAMPQVIGEVAGGLILGPSVLGLAFPGLYAWAFKDFPTQAALLSAFYWIGLILLMFVAGFRVQRELNAEDWRDVSLILISGILFPMVGGWFLTELLDERLMMKPGANPVSFHLVLAIATAVTSIPVISRIFLDLNMMSTRFAKVVLMTATLQDLVLWTALAVATGLNAAQGAEPSRIVTIVGATLVFIALSLAFGPALLKRIGTWVPIRRETSALVGYALLVCFALTAIASLLQINIVFGALVAGIVVGTFPNEQFAEVRQRIADVALWFFVPIYFAIVGLNIDLSRQLDLENVIVFVVVSSLIKFISVTAVMALSGKKASAAIDYGIAMNTRGGPGIVLASVALAFGIITETFFVTLVLASILTSLATGIWLRIAMRLRHSFD